MRDDDQPRFRVRLTGRTKTPPRTRVWRPLSGGRYTGHPSVKFEAVTVRGVDFSGITFSDFEAEGTRFVDCDFTDARIEGSLSPRRQTILAGCRFVRTRLRDADPGQARFERCLFADADLFGWSTVAAEFVECRFTGALRRVRFWGRPWGEWLERGNLRPPRTIDAFRGNDFSVADLEDVSFVGGIDLHAQILPTSPRYITLDRAPERLARARPIVAAWTPDEVRSEAMLLLDAYTDDEIAAQDELFANRHETDVSPAIADRVWDLLAGMDLG